MMGIVFSRRPATVKKLKEILDKPCIPIYNNFDEIIPGLFLGDVQGAQDVYTLEQIGVTHILNAAYGLGSCFYVDTNAKFYRVRGFNCIFKGIPALDFCFYDISDHFNEAVEFIHSALTQNGKVYVHCVVGMSRSATLVIVYLMVKKKMSAIRALKLVRSRRRITRPNDGFLRQICQLDAHLKQQK